MDFRLILFDLDGTLLDSERKILPGSLRTLQTLMKQGVRVGLATGRTLRSVSPFLEVLKPNGPLILFNGALVWDAAKNRALREVLLPRELALRALELLPEFGDLHANLYVGQEILISGKTASSRESEIKDGVPHTVVGPLAEWLRAHAGASPIKIMLIGDPPRLQEFQDRFCGVSGQPCSPPCSMIPSEWNYLELMAKGINKGAALPEIEREYGISCDQIIAFGDNLNDVELIRGCGLGIAMGNAHEDLKRHARQVIGLHTTEAIDQCLRGIFHLDPV